MSTKRGGGGGGIIETELHAAAGMPDRPEKMAAGIPMGRPGLPGEVAECVGWLVSPGAAYVTGIAVPVSGGPVPARPSS